MHPDLVVYYCGVNDLIRGAPPEYVLEQVTLFLGTLAGRLPGAKLLVLGTLPSPMVCELRLNAGRRCDVPISWYGKCWRNAAEIRELEVMCVRKGTV